MVVTCKLVNALVSCVVLVLRLGEGWVVFIVFWIRVRMGARESW